jgi:hypothetical protein
VVVQVEHEDDEIDSPTDDSCNNDRRQMSLPTPNSQTSTITFRRIYRYTTPISSPNNSLEHPLPQTAQFNHSTQNPSTQTNHSAESPIIEPNLFPPRSVRRRGVG